MTFIPQKYMCVDELVILDKCRLTHSKDFTFYLYNMKSKKRYPIRYIKSGETILLEKGDMGRAFLVYNGEGFQDYRSCIKELVYKVNEYIALTSYILITIGVKDYRLDVNQMQKDWNNDNI